VNLPLWAYGLREVRLKNLPRVAGDGDGRFWPLEGFAIRQPDVRQSAAVVGETYRKLTFVKVNADDWLWRNVRGQVKSDRAHATAAVQHRHPRS
jgi:hypothetical protein